MLSQSPAYRKYLIRRQNELIQWFMIEKNAQTPESIAKEMSEEIKIFLALNRSHNVSTDKAHAIAKESLNILIPREKERIANEIRAIIAKYKS